MFETNTQNNSALISLSRAAQLTGYHQDYLGQLCRLGKLPAQKVGRNWFTFPEALKKLSDPELVVIEENIEEEVNSDGSVNSFEFAEPQVLQNITVSQVEGLPISIRTIATPTRNMNTVQNILNTVRIESLQREVSELRQLLARLMTEVANHSVLLQNRSMLDSSTHAPDSLKHAYVSNFDFNAPYSRLNIIKREEQETQSALVEIKWQPPVAPRYSITAVVSAFAVVAAIALITFSVVSGDFFGPINPQVSTIYYQDAPVETPLQPEVAGDVLPTDSVGSLR